MKKTFLKSGKLLFILTMCVALFAGCSQDLEETQETVNDNQGNGATDVADNNEGTEEVPVVMETVQVWTNNAHSKAEDEAMVNNFNETIGKEKGIFIDYQVFGSGYDDTLNIALAAGEEPHLFKASLSKADAAEAGYIIPIEDIEGGPEFLEKYEGLINPINNQYNGKTYSVPFVAQSLGIAYNKELLAKNGFTEPPKTWEEFRNMAKVITENGEGKEFGFIEGLQSSGMQHWNGLFHYASQVGHAGWDFEKGEFALKEYSPFFQMLADMKNEDQSWFPGAEGLNNDAARARFAEGVVGFKFSASWDVGVFTDQFPAVMDWEFFRIPGPYKDFSILNELMVFGKKANDLPEKTLEVYKLFHSDEAVTKLYLEGKNLPYDFDIVKNLEIDKKDNLPTQWVEVADLSNSAVYPNPWTPARIIAIEGDDVIAVINKILAGVVSADKALTDLDSRLEAGLEQEVDRGLDIDPFLIPIQ